MKRQSPSDFFHASESISLKPCCVPIIHGNILQDIKVFHEDILLPPKQTGPQDGPNILQNEMKLLSLLNINLRDNGVLDLVLERIYEEGLVPSNSCLCRNLCYSEVGMWKYEFCGKEGWKMGKKEREGRGKKRILETTSLFFSSHQSVYSLHFFLIGHILSSHCAGHLGNQ